ncbi:GNAT family N-acetyltransferase [Trichocoleus sp. FACHB-591]|uniref:GNAT family N-acetyltransferase n=1 Tax=Trichocoleus sp. FACHB-591 TaxID=2692872 RepID=UPI0016861CAC|nr:GNAT family N-acetyltransferase [Trichocoleus sp. FACHB-591]MBD2097095.1 GNAT family N-acetyltransferase [Trichocoleus sp. FACHB-591]
MITVQLEPDVSQQDRMTLVELIRQFNHQFFTPSEWQSIAIMARDNSGVIAGGALGEIGCSWFYIRVLVVREDLRHQGIGTRLLETAEQVGREQNCVGIHLETLDFQAKEFYGRLGYSVFGVQENYPRGFNRYFMQKLFEAP